MLKPQQQQPFTRPPFQPRSDPRQPEVRMVKYPNKTIDDNVINDLYAALLSGNYGIIAEAINKTNVPLIIAASKHKVHYM